MAASTTNAAGSLVTLSRPWTSSRLKTTTATSTGAIWTSFRGTMIWGRWDCWRGVRWRERRSISGFRMLTRRGGRFMLIRPRGQRVGSYLGHVYFWRIGMRRDFLMMMLLPMRDQVLTRRIQERFSCWGLHNLNLMYLIPYHTMAISCFLFAFAMLTIATIYPFEFITTFITCKDKLRKLIEPSFHVSSIPRSTTCPNIRYPSPQYFPSLSSPPTLLFLTSHSCPF